MPGVDNFIHVVNREYLKICTNCKLSVYLVVKSRLGLIFNVSFIGTRSCKHAVRSLRSRSNYSSYNDRQLLSNIDNGDYTFWKVEDTANVSKSLAKKSKRDGARIQTQNASASKEN